MRVLLTLLLIVALGGSALAITVTTEESGEIEFLDGTGIYTTVVAGAFGPGWARASQADAYDITDVTLLPRQRELQETFDIPATAATVSLRELVRRAGLRLLEVQYDATVNQTVSFESLFVSFMLPCDDYGGKALTVRDGAGQVLQSLPLPATLGDAHLFYQTGAVIVEIAAGDQVGYTIAFSSPSYVHLQDNRAWGSGVFELRIELLAGYAGSPVPAGTQFECDFTVTFPADVTFALDPYSASSQTDTTGWFPFTLPWDGAPVDVSWLNEMPAGGHGFLAARDGRFAFEDDTPARFWGVCVSAAANFPTHAESEIIAERMAKFGVNMVRTHHADAYWSDPNLFDESYGDTQHFDADALDRFDYFIYCLKQNGIYVYLDQLVHRMFTEGDGVVNAGELPPAAKPYTLFDPTLIALQKQFSHDLWTHVNPYTGLAYKDDPAIALMEFTNENDIISHDVAVEPYATQFEDMWRDWAVANGKDPDQPVRYQSERSPDVLRFIDEVQRAYYSDMYSYLRSIGVAVPISGNTWLVSGGNLASQATMDYMDAHSYWDHPTDNYTRFHNRAQVKLDPGSGGGNFATLAMSRVEGMPFVCSEWGHPWPNEWRAEGPLATAAIGAFQQWDGILAYTYRHTHTTPVDGFTGPFDIFNDPAVLGLFPAAALMFRQEHVSTAAAFVAVEWGDSDIFGVPQLSAWGGQPSYRSLVERSRLVTSLTTPSGAQQVVSPTEFVPTSGATWTQSETNQLWRDWELGVGTIDSPRSQAAYGFLGAGGAIALGDLSLDVTSPFGVVSLVSLDGRLLRESRHLLLTAVGRAENTGTSYNLTHTKLMDPGAGPILAEPVLGQATIRTVHSRFYIYAIGPGGTRTLLTPVDAAGGSIDVPLDGSGGSIYYELSATGRFPDVPYTHWAYGEVEACAASGIVAGFPNGTYQSDLAVSRDQMAIYIARALAGGDEQVPTGPAEATFPDVATDDVVYRYVEYAYANGIVQGYGDGLYHPERQVDRGQMAVFVARAIVRPTGEAGMAGYDPPQTPTFADVTEDVADPYSVCYPHVEYIAEQDVTHGYPDLLYHPERVVTRGLMAIYVARAFELIV